MSGCGSARGEFKAVRRRLASRASIFDNVASAARDGRGDVRLPTASARARARVADEYESCDFIRDTNQDIISSRPANGQSCPLAVRALLKLNRCIRSLKLYVVVDTHAAVYSPPSSAPPRRTPARGCKTSAAARFLD